MKRWSKSLWLRLLAIFGVVAGIATVGCVGLEHEERQLTFRAMRDSASWFSGLPDGVQELNLPVTVDDSKQNIHAWWWPAASPMAPALLYLHGARWNLTAHLFRIEQLRDFGFSVFAIDYRGFGQSDGEIPSEKTVYEDAEVAWKWLSERQPEADKRYIYGHSLGGAVAVDLAAKLSESARQTHAGAPAGGLIVESTFTTLADIAREFTYPWLPVQLLLSQKFDSVHKIAEVGMPVLIVHGVGDRYVPSRFSKALFDAAPEPKKLLLIEGASHNNSMMTGETQYRQAMIDLFHVGGSDTAQANARQGKPRWRPRT